MRKPGELTFESRSAADTKRVGAALARVLTAGDVVLLHGDLGAGKTTLVQGFAEAVGMLDPVTSPTFTLIHEYHAADRLVVHVDPYRLSGPEEVEGLGFLDYLNGDAIVFVEWAERLGDLSPESALQIRIEEIGTEVRRIKIWWEDDRLAALARTLETNA